MTEHRPIIVADKVDQEACDFFSPLASASPLIERERERNETAFTTAHSSISNRSANTEIAGLPIEQKNLEAIPHHFTKYEIVSAFIAKNAVPFVWMGVCIITIASTFDLVRAFSIQKTEEAANLITQEKYQEALASATLAVRSNPFSAKAYLERGRALAKQLRLKEALECFNSSLALNKNDEVALDERASVALKLKLPKVTISDIDQLESMAPPELKAYQVGNRAIAYFSVGEYRKAQADYDRALAMDPTSYSLQLSRAFCLAQDQKYAQALSALDALAKMDPDNNEVLTQRGYCKQRLNDKKGALADYNLAIKRDNTTARWFAYRAGLFMEMQQPENALPDYIKAADLEVDNESAQYTVAKLCGTLHQPKLALKYYDRIAQFPNFRHAFNKQFERANLNLANGNYQSALVDFTNALKVKKDPETLYLQALCFGHLGQRKAALTAMEAATKLSAPTSKAYLYQAQIAASLGQNISAVHNYSQVLRLEPRNVKALTARGKFYLAQQQWGSAEADFKRVLAISSSNGDVTKGLAQATSMLGKRAKMSLDLPKIFAVDLKKLSDEQIAKDGYKYFSDGEMIKAAYYFTEAVQRKPNDLELRRLLAHSLAASGSHSDAIATFALLAQANALKANDKITYAREMGAVGQYETAIKVVEELNAANPKQYSYELAKLLSASGQDEKAMTVCASAMQQASQTERQQLESLYQSLSSEKTKAAHAPKAQPKPETEG